MATKMEQERRVAELTLAEVNDILFYLDDADMLAAGGHERMDRILVLWDRLHKWRHGIDRWGQPLTPEAGRRLRAMEVP